MSQYLEQMLARLTSAYNDMLDSNIGRLFSFAGNALDDIEVHLRRIQDWKSPDFAQGVTLDRLGKNFGVPRNGLDDNTYRFLIKLKTSAQISGGDMDTIIEATATLFGTEISDIELREIYPAKIEIEIPASKVTNVGVFVIGPYAALIKRLAAAGIGVKLKAVSTQDLEPIYFGIQPFSRNVVTQRLEYAPAGGDMDIRLNMGIQPVSRLVVNARTTARLVINQTASVYFGMADYAVITNTSRAEDKAAMEMARYRDIRVKEHTEAPLSFVVHHDTADERYYLTNHTFGDDET